jgi:hypothetical protein
VQNKAVPWGGAPFAFLVPPAQRDPGTAIEMLNILKFGEVEVHEAQSAFVADGERDYRDASLRSDADEDRAVAR